MRNKEARRDEISKASHLFSSEAKSHHWITARQQSSIHYVKAERFDCCGGLRTKRVRYDHHGDDTRYRGDAAQQGPADCHHNEAEPIEHRSLPS